MATWYTDVATNQQQNVNFPGKPGVGTLTTQPGSQNLELIEGPLEIVATYTWVGTEATNDVINIAKLEPGWLVDPFGHVSSGVLSMSNVATVTVQIGDNDLAPFAGLPITNAAAVQATGAIQQTSMQAPMWVSATVYAPGNVVYDNTSVPVMCYTCIKQTTASQTTAPHSDSTYWIPNAQRYSQGININGNYASVAWASGTQIWGGPLSVLPNSVVPNSVPSGATAAQIANSQYQIQGDCWLQALITAATTANIVANQVSVFRATVLTAN